MSFDTCKSACFHVYLPLSRAVLIQPGKSTLQPVMEVFLLSVAADRIKASSRLTKGYLICLVGTFLWSSTAVFIRYLVVTFQLPAMVLAFWRDFLVFTFLLLIFAAVRPTWLRVARNQLRFLAIYGLLLSIFNASWTFSVALNGAAVSTVLVYSSAAFTALLGWRMFAESFGPWKILAILLSLAGCVLVSGAWSASAWQVNPLGIVIGLSSGLAFAAYSLFGKAASNRGISPWTTLLYTFGIAAAFLLVYNLLPAAWPGGVAENLWWLGSSLAGWAVLVLLAIGPTVGGYGLYTVSLTYLPASVANLIATLEPALTAGLAFLFLGERLSAVQLSGGLMILAGVVLLRLREGATLLESSPAGPS
jgi:drug/metabolite transporter (DMT)-like permease